MATVHSTQPTPTCLITEPQEKLGLKTLFARHAKIIYLRRWGTKGSFKPRMLEQVAKAINLRQKALVFGSNNLFFYDLIPYLAPRVTIIDLTHSITPKQEWCETYSIPHISRINNRVVLGPDTLEVFRSIYEAYDIPDRYMERFSIIANKVPTPPQIPEKAGSGPLEVLFVGRNSQEKRPELFFRIVDACVSAGLDITFTVVGDFGSYKKQYATRVHFTDELKEKAVLDRYYRQAHLVLITSTFEGFPMVLLEGMAQGVVPVCTAVGEIPRFISAEKQTGYTIDSEGRTDELAERFVQVIRDISSNRTLLSAFSRSAYKLVKENFSEKQFETAYRRLLVSCQGYNVG